MIDHCVFTQSNLQREIYRIYDLQICRNINYRVNVNEWHAMLICDRFLNCIFF